MSQRVEGKVALITGAARGQGRSHAVRLAEEGADIIALDLCEPIEGVPYDMPTREDLDETVALVEKLGRRIVAEPADVRNLEQVTDLVDRGVAELGRLDVVSANAGISSTGLSHELSEESWNRMIDINLTGVWRTCRAAIPHLIAGGRGGSIAITSSVVGLRGAATLSHYAASKHGVVGLAQSLANELGQHMIRVNTIHPTQVETPMIMNQALFDVFRPDIENPSREQAAEASQSMMAMPLPWIQPEDVSNALLFLASDEARYITGTALRIDLGHITRM